MKKKMNKLSCIKDFLTTCPGAGIDDIGIAVQASDRNIRHLCLELCRKGEITRVRKGRSYSYYSKEKSKFPIYFWTGSSIAILLYTIYLLFLLEII